ncbi:hypothetical protein HY837_02645 [archaeon]|nr:hypothetical protein [archaeon]
MGLVEKLKWFCLEYFTGANAGKFYQNEKWRAEYDLWDKPIDAKRKKNFLTLVEIIDRGVSKGIPNIIFASSIIYGANSGKWDYALTGLASGEIFRNLTSFVFNRSRLNHVEKQKKEMMFEEQFQEENYRVEEKKSSYDGWLSPEDRYNDP